MILDLYAGCGGVAEGLRSLGLDEVGIEWDGPACATRAAAGHRTIRADVATYPAERFAGRVEGMWLSPPCTTFSSAGAGEGRKMLDRLVGAVHAGTWSSVDPDRSGGWGHVLEVGRWVDAVQPRWVACEQVPPVLPVWQAYAERWRRQGWSTWAGVLCAADYGVSQTRSRAILIASRNGLAHPPLPTHAEHPTAGLFGPELAPWVSMAEALGWSGDGVDRPARTVAGHRQPRWLYPDADGSHGEIVVRTGANSMVTGRTGSRAGDGDVLPYERSVRRPAPTVDSKVGTSWRLNRRQVGGDGTPVPPVSGDRPAPTLTGIAGAKGQWVWERPATTLTGDARAFGPHSGSAGEPQSSNTIGLELHEALILQSFRPDYPVQGNKSERFTQVGNAVPPVLAMHVAAAASGRRLEQAAA